MNVQMELLRPEQLNAIRDSFPVAYIPLGALEFHGHHLPVGLDTVKCHRMLIRMAEQIGGMVAPPVFFGHGSGHIGFPWTWMLDSRDTLKTLLLTMCRSLDCNGIKVIVVMSGHYPNESVFDELKSEFADGGGAATILPMMEYHAFDKNEEWHGDHAAKWETSYMLALGEELVDMHRLRENPDGTSLDQVKPPCPPEGSTWWFEKNPSHPWFGIAANEGNRPTDASVELGLSAVDAIIAWARPQILEALAAKGWKRR
jgi:creatinine amidohydrolase